MDEGGAHRGEDEDLPGERDLLHDGRVPHDGAGGRREAGREEVPDEEPGQQVDGEERDAVLQDQLEHDVEDDQVQRRVQHRPDEAERAVLVLDLQLLADQLDQQLPEAPDLAEALRHAGPAGDPPRRLCRCHPKAFSGPQSVPEATGPPHRDPGTARPS